jgi:hypothetical protein
MFWFSCVDCYCRARDHCVVRSSGEPRQYLVNNFESISSSTGSRFGSDFRLRREWLMVMTRFGVNPRFVQQICFDATWETQSKHTREYQNAVFEGAVASFGFVIGRLFIRGLYIEGNCKPMAMVKGDVQPRMGRAPALFLGIIHERSFFSIPDYRIAAFSGRWSVSSLWKEQLVISFVSFWRTPLLESREQLIVGSISPSE